MFHTCSRTEKRYSFLWNLIPTEQSLINLYCIFPKLESAISSLQAPHLFCSPFHSNIAAFISEQQKSYSAPPVLTFWWYGLAIDDSRQIPISRAAMQCAVSQRQDIPCLTRTHHQRGTSTSAVSLCNTHISIPRLWADSEADQTSNYINKCVCICLYLDAKTPYQSSVSFKVVTTSKFRNHCSNNSFIDNR